MSEPDATVELLAELFREHPAWRSAARRIEPGSTSLVRFSHRPGEVWHLERRGETTYLEPGTSRSPDFSFRFTPDSVSRLAAVDGGIGDFAVALFGLMTHEDPALRVGFRVLAPFGTLMRHGYVGLLAAGGARVLAFGAARGVRTLGQLRALVEQLRRPEPWERESAPPEREDER